MFMKPSLYEVRGEQFGHAGVWIVSAASAQEALTKVPGLNVGAQVTARYVGDYYRVR